MHIQTLFSGLTPEQCLRLLDVDVSLYSTNDDQLEPPFQAAIDIFKRLPTKRSPAEKLELIQRVWESVENSNALRFVSVHYVDVVVLACVSSSFPSVCLLF